MSVDNNLLNFIKTEIPQLLNQLQADTPAQWGVMSAQHMVEHLGGSFLLGTGRFPVKPMYNEEKTQRSYDYIIKARQPFMKGVKINMVPVEPAPYRFASLEEAKEKLLNAVQQFFDYFEQNPDAKLPHPAFGSLDYADFIVFEAQHAKHHFLQFGLIDSY
ncbi:MAG: DinB family protein [Aureispira sp.]|nr:DinB family protein [Aureispira sp.]